MSRFAGRHLVVRAAVATVGVAAIMLVSACGAGQIAETAKIQSAVPGASGITPVPHDPADKNAPDGQILAQNVTLEYTGPAGYSKGGTAPLEIRIINNSPVDVLLTGAASPLGRVTLGGTSSAPANTASAPASPTTSPSQSGTPAPQPTPAPAATSVRIPSGQIVELTTTSGLFLQINNLASDLKSGQTTDLTLSFENASDPGTSINNMDLFGIPIAPPPTAATRQAIPGGGTEH